MAVREICSELAARAKLPASTTATKARIC